MPWWFLDAPDAIRRRDAGHARAQAALDRMLVIAAREELEIARAVRAILAANAPNEGAVAPDPWHDGRI